MTIVIAIIVFGIIIFIHELGHYLACRWAGVKVNEFALGMGPKLISKKIGETVYSIRAVPLGGFCSMEGEDEESADPRSFVSASVFKRFVILVAGSLMNLILGLVILSVLTVQKPYLGSTVVADFREEATSSAVLQVDDEILKVNNHTVRSDNDLIYEFQRDRDGIMDMQVLRNDEKIVLEDVTFKMQDLGDGVQAISVDFVVYQKEKTFTGVIFNSFNWTASIVKQVWGSLVDLISGRYGLNQLAGPVGVTTAIGQAASMGFATLLNFVAFITINLGVFNLLPLPALDGGRLMFVILEAVRRKPLAPKYEGYVHATGFILLIGLMIFVSFNDIVRLITNT